MDTKEKIVCEKDIHNAIKYAVQDMVEGSFYAPLMDRFPLITKNLPPKVLAHLRAHQSPACADRNNVYVDTEAMADMINDLYSNDKTRRKMTSVDMEIRNIIIHEYTHILCQHAKQGVKYQRTGDAHKMKTFMTACEIEANRGYRINRCSATYAIAVTEEKFPETIGVKFLPEIYETLLKKYGNDIENCKKPDENMEQEQESQEESGSGDEQGQDGFENQSEEKSTLTDEQRQAIENMLAKDADLDDDSLEQEMKQSEEQGEKQEGSSLESVLDEIGLPGKRDESDIPDDEKYATPEQKLKYISERYKARQVGKELAKLKGVIEGKVSRERISTYSRQSRKQSDDGLIRKGTKRGGRSVPRILLAMDDSGSMQSTTNTQIASSIAGIFDVCGRPSKGCYICRHREYVVDVMPMKKWQEVAKRFHPSGGNDFTEVVRKALELDVDVVLNVGDGYDRIYMCNRKDIEEFGKRGIKWYDCLVGEAKYHHWAHEAMGDNEEQKRDHIEHIVERHLIDLTGKTSQTERSIYEVN